MDLGLATWWWVAAGALVVFELITSTFYLLMLALGATAGAIAAHLGTPATLQIVAAAAVGGLATSLWHWKRSRGITAPAEANRDVNLDIGEQVQVTTWNTNGTARVQYRGAQWTARYAGPDTPLPGEHFIVAVEGNRLVLAPIRSSKA
jgi:membrane protein implicated in regulation of membrane protease activity